MSRNPCQLYVWERISICICICIYVSLAACLGDMCPTSAPLLQPPFRSVHLNPYLKRLFLQLMMINTKPCNWPRCRKQGAAEFSGLNGTYQHPFFPRLRVHCGRGDRKTRRGKRAVYKNTVSSGHSKARQLQIGTHSSCEGTNNTCASPGETKPQHEDESWAQDPRLGCWAICHFQLGTKEGWFSLRGQCLAGQLLSSERPNIQEHLGITSCSSCVLSE